ncbi:hypothetical protein Tiera_040 [Polaromonas phage Tiera]|nr:hypothetical protein Tiera_040 [Polaromonas phage Tiera]
MPIELVPPVPDDDDIEFLEEDSNYTFRQLLDHLLTNGESLMTVPNDEVARLRTGLSIRKAKDNRIAQRKGLLENKQVLSYATYPAKDENGKELPGLTTVRVKLADRKGVTIVKLEAPTSDF